MLKSRLPGLARLSLESFYLFGAFLGAIGAFALLSPTTSLDIAIGIGFVVISLIIQLSGHRALNSNSSAIYADFGKIFFALLGFSVFFFEPRLSLTYRMTTSLLCLGVAAGLHFRNSFAEMFWQVCTFFLTIGAAVHLKSLVVENPMVQLIIPSGYIVFSLIFATKYRWVKRRFTPRTGLKNLWGRGRLLEIFDIQEDFTGIDLAAKYRDKMNLYHGHQKEEQILKEARSILTVPVRYQLYRKSRKIMADIGKTLETERFRRDEPIIWKGLWDEIRDKYDLRPELITPVVERQLRDKYTKRK